MNAPHYDILTDGPSVRHDDCDTVSYADRFSTLNRKAVQESVAWDFTGTGTPWVPNGHESHQVIGKADRALDYVQRTSRDEFVDDSVISARSKARRIHKRTQERTDWTTVQLDAASVADIRTEAGLRKDCGSSHKVGVIGTYSDYVAAAATFGVAEGDLWTFGIWDAEEWEEVLVAEGL